MRWSTSQSEWLVRLFDGAGALRANFEHVINEDVAAVSINEMVEWIQMNEKNVG